MFKFTLPTVQACGAIGPAAKDAIPALQAAMNDRSPAVRDAARSALGKITGERPALTTTP
jgi:HEAT repeat protein